MKNWSEYFFLELACTVEFDNCRSDISATCRRARFQAKKNCATRVHRGNPAVELALGLAVDDGADMRRKIARISKAELARRPADHIEHAIGNIFLHAQQPQCRAALTGRAEGGRNDIVR